MEAISEELVNKTRKEIAALSREEANREMLRTCESQPDLVAYMTKMTEGRKTDVQELAIYLLFAINRIFKKGAGRNLNRIGAKNITKFHENNLQLMKRLEADHNEFVSRAARIQLAGQPHVMKYLVGALVKPTSGDVPIELNDEEKGFLYVLLKTSVDLLDEKG